MVFVSLRLAGRAQFEFWGWISVCIVSDVVSAVDIYIYQSFGVRYFLALLREPFCVCRRRLCSASLPF